MKALSLLFCFLASAAFAAEPTPDVLKGVGIEPKLGTAISLNTLFQDESGKEVRLGDFFGGHKPVALILSYYGCPMLCGVLLNAARDSFMASDWKMGEQYTAITISFDPNEKYSLAAAKKASIIRSVKDPEKAAAAKTDWHFLVGSKESIAKITEELGFRYKWVLSEQQFAHGAAIYFLSPKGKISRVLLGMNFPQKDLKLALLEASEGKVGSLAEKLVSFCYHYDPKDNTYAIFAANLMKLAGAATVAVVLFAYLVMLLRKRERNA